MPAPIACCPDASHDDPAHCSRLAVRPQGQDCGEHQAGKVSRALAALEADPPVIDGIPHVGQIALACALGYQDLRFGGRWRDDHERLVEWLDVFAARVPAFDATRPTA